MLFNNLIINIGLLQFGMLGDIILNAQNKIGHISMSYTFFPILYQQAQAKNGFEGEGVLSKMLHRQLMYGLKRDY